MQVKVELLNAFGTPAKSMKSLTSKHLSPKDAKELYDKITKLISNFNKDK